MTWIMTKDQERSSMFQPLIWQSFYQLPCSESELPAQEAERERVVDHGRPTAEF